MQYQYQRVKLQILVKFCLSLLALINEASKFYKTVLVLCVGTIRPDHSRRVQTSKSNVQLLKKIWIWNFEDLTNIGDKSLSENIALILDRLWHRVYNDSFTEETSKRNPPNAPWTSCEHLNVARSASGFSALQRALDWSKVPFVKIACKDIWFEENQGTCGLWTD